MTIRERYEDHTRALLEDDTYALLEGDEPTLGTAIEPGLPGLFSPGDDVRFALENITSGGVTTLDVPLDDYYYTNMLNRPGALTGKLSLRSPYATEELLRPWRTAIYAVRGGRVEWGGILTPPSMQTASDVLDLAAFGWTGYWDRRDIRTDYTPVQVDQFQIIARLITDAQDETTFGAGYDLGIDVTWDALSGVLRDRTDDYRPWKTLKIGDALRQLAAVHNGFDFAMTYALNTETDRIDKALKLYSPVKGRVTGFLFEYETGRDDTNITARGFADPTEFAWTGDGWGAGTDALRIFSPYIDETLRGEYPPYDAAPSWSDVSVQATLDEHTAATFARTNRPHPVPVIRVDPTRYPQWGDYELGDVVGLRINDGYGSTPNTMVQTHRITGLGVRPGAVELVLDTYDGAG